MGTKYTIEDFEWMCDHPTTCTDPDDPIYQKHAGIRGYFIQHPEELLECERCKKHGYTAEDIKGILEGTRPGHFWP